MRRALLVILTMALLFVIASPTEAFAQADDLDQERLEEYTKIRNLWRFASPTINLCILAFLFFSGFSRWLYHKTESFLPRLLRFPLYIMALMLSAYLLRLPFSIWRGYIVELDFGMRNQSFGLWLGDYATGVLLLSLQIVIVAVVFYWLVNRFKHWWLIFTAIMAPLIVVGVILTPLVINPIFNNFTPLPEGDLRNRIEALSAGAGADDPEILVMDASKRSPRVNAYVTGLLGSKRIVLYDTLLDRLTEDEVLEVVAHELGHYVMHHIWWGVGAAILILLFWIRVFAYLLPRILARLPKQLLSNGLSSRSAFPVILALVLTLDFMSKPMANYVSRTIEYQADSFAFELSGRDLETAKSVRDKLGKSNLSDPDPHPFVEFWFYTHPSPKSRLENIKRLAGEQEK